MSIIQVFHNPRFLEYRGSHDELLLPVSPTASIEIEAGLSSNEQLDKTYVRTQHGVHYARWFHNLSVILHLVRSSVNDLLALDDDQMLVVERLEFQLSQPGKTYWPTVLAEQCARWKIQQY